MIADKVLDIDPFGRRIFAKFPGSSGGKYRVWTGKGSKTSSISSNSLRGAIRTAKRISKLTGVPAEVVEAEAVAVDHWEDQSLPTRTAQEVIMRLTRMGFSEEEVARLISQVLVLGQLGCVSTEHLSKLVRRIVQEG